MSAAPKFTGEQSVVIRHRGSNSLVRAVAGSGKSTALTARIAYLLRNGVAREDILVVQFGKAARQDFIAKLARRVGDESPAVETFHSLGQKLARNLERVGRLERRTIDLPRCEKLAREALRVAWRAHNPTNPMPRDVRDAFAQFVTLAKATLEPIRKLASRRFSNVDTVLVGAFLEYEKQRQKAAIRNHDDQLYDPIPHLLAHPEDWPLARPRPIRHLLVDEFQDVNAIQYAMVRGLTTADTEVMAVGDPAQAIFSFRGSGVDFIEEHFERDFAPVTALTMTRNFRYGHRTALLANHIIHVESPANGDLTLPAADNPDTELALVPERPQVLSAVPGLLAARHAEGTLSDAVVLVRNYEHAVPHEIALISAQIPYFNYGRVAVLFVPEIAALIGALSVATDSWAIEPEARAPFVKALLQAPSAFLTGPWVDAASEYAQDSADIPEAFETYAQAHRGQDARNAAALIERASQLRALQQTTSSRSTPAEILALYLNMTNAAAVIQRTASTSDRAAEQLGYIDHFCKLVGRYASAPEAISALGEMAAMMALKPPVGDHVAIGSIHGAKGKEWAHVVLVGWAEGSFPLDMPDTDAAEERRLAYVAVTRATHRLEILHPYDPLLDGMQKHVDELEVQVRARITPTPPATRVERRASSFLYDAEPGICRAMGDGLATGTALPTRMRNATLVNRYCTLLGIPHRAEGRVTTNPNVRRGSQPVIGSIIDVKDLGVHTVVRMVDHRIVELLSPEGAKRFVVIANMQWAEVLGDVS